jgi:DNA polymerase III epsilon subunit family exonuclease
MKMTPPTDSWQKERYVVIDVEGNGASPPEIVEIACIVVDNGRITNERRAWLVKPSTPISPMVSRIHGIRDADVADAPTFSNIAPEVLDLIDDRVLVAHNAAVEETVLGRALGDKWHPAATIDTLRLAKAVLPSLARYGLPAVAEQLGIAAERLEGQRHRAMYDAMLTADVFLKLVDTADVSTFQQLRELSTTKSKRTTTRPSTDTPLF